ncbi:hypothetical protein BUALT_Bualt12G0074700 [Buddleja alternifolia]|uniref:Glycosyl transferase family 1 domain-containing protein n=1 Tax=Buddleja alternifolia TaxID=168488 RepID=A0AAV6WZU4_9LAMI|nr:hypothetical protein BUALT_Bualt12G0074700 [Buddleja alternifolia]
MEGGNVIRLSPIGSPSFRRLNSPRRECKKCHFQFSVRKSGERSRKKPKVVIEDVESGVDEKIPKQNTTYGLLVGSFGSLEDTILEKGSGTCDRKGTFGRLVWSRKFVLIFHELSMTGAPLAMLELATEFLSCGATISVIVLNKKGGLMPELSRRKIKVLEDESGLRFKTAMKADLIIAGSAVCCSWIGENNAGTTEKIVKKRMSLRDAVRKEMGLTDDDMLVVTLSTIYPGKGHLLLLEWTRLVIEQGSLIKNKDSILTDHDYYYSRTLHQKKEESLKILIGSAGSECNKSVLWTPVTTLVASLYAAADVYVMNSQGLGETFGRVTIEAMAFGLPEHLGELHTIAYVRGDYFLGRKWEEVALFRGEKLLPFSLIA